MIVIIIIVNIMGTSRRTWPAVFALAAALAACSSAGDDPGLSIAATTDIVRAMTESVAPSGVEVTGIMPPGADPHAFQASPSQVAELRSADLIVTSGLGLEEGLEAVLDEAEAGGVTVLSLGEALDPVALGEGGALDPHWWMDAARGRRALELIGAALAEVAPAEADGIATRVAESADRLAELDREIVAMVDALPADRRRIVTGHDFLGYFADRYGLEVAATVVPGGSTLAAPSAADLAALAELVANEKIPAIFTDATEPHAIGVTGAAAAGLPDVVEVDAGSLGAAAGYEEMLRAAATTIVGALAP